MTDYQALMNITQDKLVKALSHLEYSYKIIIHLPEEIENLNEETLAAWESFSARFSRVVDLFLSRYIRACVLVDDPGFSGTFRDFINQAEKLKIIDDARKWMEIRALRNITAHEYNDKDLTEFFVQLKKSCPTLLAIKKLLS